MQKCINIMMCSYRLLGFGHEFQELILSPSGVSTPDLQGGCSPTLTVMWALSGTYSKKQRISHKKEERYVDVWLISYFSDSFPHP